MSDGVWLHAQLSRGHAWMLTWLPLVQTLLHVPLLNRSAGRLRRRQSCSTSRKTRSIACNAWAKATWTGQPLGGWLALELWLLATSTGGCA